MSISLTAITNSNTFGQWKDRTNQIITALGGVVTIGDSETNTGNIVIGGNIKSTGTLYANTISTYSGNLITLSANLKLSGALQVNSTSASEIKLYLSDTLTWTIGTNATHTQLDIKKGTSLLRFDTATGKISSSNFVLDSTLFPTSISSDTTGKAATADAWTTGRTITLTGDVTGTSLAWKGDGNISFEATVTDNSHAHTTANITGLSTALDGKLSLAGGSMTGTLIANNNVSIQVGTTSTSATAIKRGIFGTVADAFSITTSGTNVDTYISLPGTTLYVANGTTTKTSFDSSGNMVTVGDITAFGTVSDINRKENIVRIPNALAKIKLVSGYTYNYIGDPTPMTGVVAQEFEEILPEVVYDAVLVDGTVSKAVRHGNIVGLLIEAIKELELQIEELKKSK